MNVDFDREHGTPMVTEAGALNRRNSTYLKSETRDEAARGSPDHKGDYDIEQSNQLQQQTTSIDNNATNGNNNKVPESLHER